MVVPRGRPDSPTLTAIGTYLETTGFAFEVLTPEGADYGSSLRRGVGEARGHVIVIADRDLPYPVSAIGDAVAMVESSATEVVFATTQDAASGGALARWLLVPLLPDPSICLAAFSSAAAKACTTFPHFRC